MWTRVETMTKNEKRIEVFKKLNDEQLKMFVKDLTYRQYLILFESKYWTGDELRSLFASMNEEDSKRFFNEMTNEQYEILWEMIIGDEEDIEKEKKP